MSDNPYDEAIERAERAEREEFVRDRREEEFLEEWRERRAKFAEGAEQAEAEHKHIGPMYWVSLNDEAYEPNDPKRSDFLDRADIIGERA